GAALGAKRQAKELGCDEILAFATSAVRDAGNSAEVLERVSEEAGIDLIVLSGDEEARLTFLAVRRWLGWSAGRIAALDMGGGSLELAAGADEAPDVAISLPLGAGRLTRDWLEGDRPAKSAIAALREHVEAEVAAAAKRLLDDGPADRVVATSKTFRTL